ncbi:hypothetical protein RHGRI_002142 [Rhododendron griersonianum]|uniref:BHLH domain-containing protein n=1 Tax=Rhododendron griersonianum TaxID=479676 RepID=A0AAV6LQ16_9ERIC|nr:hypothetical protein RHGRI_002142 [Rhododendron griersonianum]
MFHWIKRFPLVRLLIWEECYYESLSSSILPHNSGIQSSELAFEEWEGRWVTVGAKKSQVGVRAEDKVSSLINKMMSDNRVKVLGQGLVGRAAFTGNHLWILSENYAGETHPSEVQTEVCHQFSAGIRTVAVIPVLGHGVVQLGSSLDVSHFFLFSSIMENMAFLNDAKSLIAQLGCVSGALLSDYYTSKEQAPRIGLPAFPRRPVFTTPAGNHMVKDSVPSVTDSCNQQSVPSQVLELVGHPSNSVIGASSFQRPEMASNGVQPPNDVCQPNVTPVMKPSFPFSSQFDCEQTEAEVIQLNPELWLNPASSPYNLRSGFNEQFRVNPMSANYSNLGIMEEQIFSDFMKDHANNSLSTSGGIMMSQLRTNGGLGSSEVQLHRQASNSNYKSMVNSCSLPAVSGLNAGSSNTEVSASDLTDHFTASHLLLGNSDFRHQSKKDTCSQIEVGQRNEHMANDVFQALDIPSVHLDRHTNLSEIISCSDLDSQRHDYGNQNSKSKAAKSEDKPPSGDDLFDILGVDFKNKLFNDSWNSFLDGGPDSITKPLNKNNYASSNLEDADSELYSGIFCATGTDHLLDAVVGRVPTAAKQSSDDNDSCKTVLTKISSSSVPNLSPSYGRINVSDQMQGNLSGLPKSLAKLAAVGSCSFKSECSKEDTGNYSRTSSVCGSQMSSWAEQAHSMKHNSSTSGSYSKRPDEVSKSNRKRLKPGENPRPRPKDRQMIQDRMKELREIVPNGAKCSIDALLERTIKHMLFLQSVTKHADKLKQAGESKIINTDGGLLMKDNLEGGRTWAYEVGSQSMVCPIIVEDLNRPRQMLVEMLCEERGLFLEIADIIRGLGLTILKGVMETRNDKIWARFAVEANRDVTRMEIFVSLVHLLEQTIKNNAVAPGNGIENGNMMVHQSFHQGTSIPATGQPCGLQ